jgi:uncharacterized protein
MSERFVSDPRQIVKPGDVVRVKVLAVDEARKRISLTLRLDADPVGGAGGEPRGREQRADERGRRGGQRDRGQPRRGDRRVEPHRPAPNGAMADALRRAGFDTR